MKKISAKKLLNTIYGSRVVDDGEEIGFPEHDYWIEKSRLSNDKKVLGWVVHLSEKTWVDAQALGDFVRMAQKTRGVKV